MARKFDELRTALYDRSPRSRSRVDAKVRRLRGTFTLSEMRAWRGLTQVQVAEALGSVQPAVSRLERQQDWLVSTLREYVAATGGTLRLVATYGDEELEVDAR